MPTHTVTTRYGDVQVHVTSDKAIVVVAGNVVSGEYETAPLVINRTEIGIRYTLERGTGTRITIGNSDWEMAYTTARVTPLDWRRMNDMPSESVRRKIRDEVLVSVVNFLSENPDVLDDGRTEQLRRQLDSQSEKVDRLRDELAAAVAEEHRLIDALEAERISL